MHAADELSAGGASRPGTGTRIGVFTEADLPDVVALFGRAFPQHRWQSLADCEAYFREVFFHHPWRDLGLASLVARIEGRVAGFYGVIPRPMRFRGREIRVAVGCNVMVDPAAPALVALELARAQLAGPQDLTLADGATARALGIWRGLGGEVPLAFNLHWTRELRPARCLLWRHGQRTPARRLLSAGARPLAAIIDAIAAQLRTNRLVAAPAEIIEDALEPATMAEALPQLTRSNALVPVYTRQSLAWMLGQMAVRQGHGTLRARRVQDGDRRLLGWYIYYLNGRGPSELVQLVARGGAYTRVLECLFADAWRNDAIAVRGRLGTDDAATLSERGCWLRWEGPGTLVHSRHPEIIEAIRRDDAFLSRLDGEWWMRFVST